MSEKNEETRSPQPRACRRPRGRRIAGFLAALALVGLAVPIAWARWGGPGRWHGHFHGHKQMTVEQARDHADRVAGHVLDEVDATDEQQARVAALLDVAVPELFGLRTQGKELKEAFHAALSAETPDRAGMERVRVEGLKLADEASAKAVELLADLAEVLTPEQRAQLHERMEEKHGRR